MIMLGVLSQTNKQLIMQHETLNSWNVVSVIAVGLENVTSNINVQVKVSAGGCLASS